MYDLDKEIGGLPFMLELDDYDRSRITSIFRAVSKQEKLPAGSVLFASGDTASDDGYIVYEGVVVIEGPDGV
ncbi:MAG TPA: hypothetical protein PK869_09770, partial [Candidatus Hydrogenedentes bacterium]|nr:hypothetical protein [Candidatus Hydrogenedentota bacterium]